MKGAVKGLVKDTKTGPLPGVKVAATSSALLGTRETYTDREGRFELEDLPEGEYTIRASVEGFTTAKVFTTIKSGETAEVSITLLLAMVMPGDPPPKD